MKLTFFTTALISCNVMTAWGAYLMYRQRKSYEVSEVPAPLQENISAEEYAKSRHYAKEKMSFSLVEHAVSLVQNNVELLLRVPAWLYYRVARDTNVVAGTFLHCYTFVVVSDVLNTILSLPFDYYKTFVVEQRHGFNKMSVAEFVKDQIKSFALRVVLLYPMYTGLVQWVVHRFGERFPLYIFAAGSVISLAAIFVYYPVIAPLFNTYTPLAEDQPLYAKIKALTARVHYPLRKVFVVDASKRSAHSNLYMYGFWHNKRIVIFDTFLEQARGDDDQVLAALCHELGHWQYSHSVALMMTNMALMLAVSYSAKEVIFNPAMYQQFGFTNMDPVVGFSLFSAVFLQPIMTALGYATAYVTRQFEFQADRFTVEMGYGEAMQHTLITIAKENKVELVPDRLYSALMHSHPPIAERLQAIKAIMHEEQRAEDGAPKKKKLA